MKRDDVIMTFNELIEGKREKIIFSKGYEIFESVYETFCEDFELTREEDGYMTIITYND